MTSPPRVLHVIDSLRLGGAEALLSALVRELRRSGRAWNAVCVPDVGEADPGLVSAVREQADAFRWLPVGPLYDPRPVRVLNRTIAVLGIQVVHSHLSTANVASRVAAAARRRPHLATIHTVPGPAAEDTRLRAFADGWSSWLSRRLVAPSAEVADAYRAAFHLPRGRMRVIPNVPAAKPPPADFDRQQLRREVAGEDAEQLVIAVARLQPEKGIDDLVAAMAQLRPRFPGLRVAVAGAGPEEAALARHIEATGLSGSFFLLGSRSDVGSLLAAADAFCLPSRHEGMPISLLEAMQAGLPCVATRVGGVPGMITDGDEGALVAPADPDALAAALKKVLIDRQLAGAMGRRAQELVRRRYDISAATAAYADIYDELVRPPSAEPRARH